MACLVGLRSSEAFSSCSLYSSAFFSRLSSAVSCSTTLSNFSRKSLPATLSADGPQPRTRTTDDNIAARARCLAALSYMADLLLGHNDYGPIWLFSLCYKISYQNRLHQFSENQSRQCMMSGKRRVWRQEVQDAHRHEQLWESARSRAGPRARRSPHGTGSAHGRSAGVGRATSPAVCQRKSDVASSPGSQAEGCAPRAGGRARVRRGLS